jgi:hypothetical protein
MHEGRQMSREIMQQALDAMAKYQVKSGDFDRFDDVIKNLRQAIAQPEQVITPISPDQYERLCGTCGACIGKPWVGLTNDEIDKCDRNSIAGADSLFGRRFYKAIEAKLKELNK